jgi:hypothetical protein
MCSKRLFEHAKLLVIGAILVSGKRPITAVLRVRGNSQECQVQTSHRVLSWARRPALRGGRMLRPSLVRAYVATGRIVIGMDETIARRRGGTMAAEGIDRNPVRSSQAPCVKARGLRWVCLMRLAPVPLTTPVGALPFLPVLSPSACDYAPRSCSAQPLGDCVRLAR